MKRKAKPLLKSKATFDPEVAYLKERESRSVLNNDALAAATVTFQFLRISISVNRSTKNITLMGK